MAVKTFRTIVILECLVCLKHISTAVPASRAVTIEQPSYFTHSVKNNSDISTMKSTTVNTITLRTASKRGLQPWSLATEVDSTTNPVDELTTLHDAAEPNTEVAQLRDEVFNANTIDMNISTNSSTLSNMSKSSAPLAINSGSDFANSSKEQDITVTATAVSKNASTTTVDAANEAVNTIKTTTKSNANEMDSVTESTTIPYRRDPLNDSHTFECTHTSPTIADDIITIAFANSEITEKSDAALVQPENETVPNTFINVEEPKTDIIQPLLDVKTEIEKLPTDFPQTTAISKFGKNAINESKSNSVTEYVRELTTDNVGSNLTAQAAILKYMNITDDYKVIANVTILQKDSNATGENGTTTIPGSAKLENATVADSWSATTDSQNSARVFLTENTNETISVKHLSIVSTAIQTEKSQSSNVTSAFISSLIAEKNTAADTPTTNFPVSEQNLNQNMSLYSNDTELTTHPYDDSLMTVTEDKNDKNNADASSESAELHENYGNVTVTNRNGSESGNFEFGQNETQMSQDSKNETTAEIIQSERSGTVKKNLVGVKPHETEKPENQSSINYGSERNVAQVEIPSKAFYESEVAVRSNLVTETDPKRAVTTNYFEYSVTVVNTPGDNSINQNVSESVTLHNNHLNTRFSETDQTTRNESNETKSNFITITTQKTIQSTSIQETAKYNTLMSVKTSDIIESDSIVTVNFPLEFNNTGIEPEEYIIFNQTDESFILDATFSQVTTVSEETTDVSQETTESTVTARNEKNEQSLVNSTTKTETTISESDTIMEVPDARSVTTSILKDFEISRLKMTPSTRPDHNLTNISEKSTSLTTIISSAGDFHNNHSIAITTNSSTVSNPSSVYTNGKSIYRKTAAEKLAENIIKYDFTTSTIENETHFTNTTTDSFNESNYTEIYYQKLVNSVYMLPEVFSENAYVDKTKPVVINLGNRITGNIVFSTTFPQKNTTSKHEDHESNGTAS